VKAVPDSILARAVQLHQTGDLDGAIRLYRKALRRTPEHAPALNLLGLAWFQVGDLDEAESSLQRALALQPDFPDAHYNLGIIQYRRGRFEDSAENLKRAISSRPKDPEARATLGAALNELGENSEAIEYCRQAIALDPKFAGAHVNLGNALLALHQVGEAIRHYEIALQIAPDLIGAHVCMAAALVGADRFHEAVRCGERALLLNPGHAEAHMVIGNALVELGRRDEAISHYRKVLELDPTHTYAFGALAGALLGVCDWSRYFEIKRKLEQRIRGASSRIDPLVALFYLDDPALHLQCARNAIGARYDNVAVPAQPRAAASKQRIRVAYVTSDIRRHPMSYLFGELFALHDRGEFEIVGISTGPDDGTELRSRIVRSFDQFHDVRFHSDDEIAALVERLGADILVDLNGHTTHSRFGVFARRPAPIQVTYLGYPGTTGANFMDYVVGDPVVLPMDQQPFFSEKIVHLPDSYQVNDRNRKISDLILTRKEAGLPDGFVFCCFNKSDKISPEIFDIWMRLLKRVDGSVLWLIADEAARRNLREEAEARGVDPDSLVFASHLKNEEHLARHKLADLFLDTLPYNAHTTASDALWAGLPVITRMGNAFAGRVAASLLKACDLPELITSSAEEYEALAVRLATEPYLLSNARAKLERSGTSSALFDTPRFCRNLESAYRMMLSFAARGGAARSFAVVG
jgi:protein O-GlcNAc transferase